MSPCYQLPGRHSSNSHIYPLSEKGSNFYSSRHHHTNHNLNYFVLSGAGEALSLEVLSAGQKMSAQDHNLGRRTWNPSYHPTTHENDKSGIWACLAAQ